MGESPREFEPRRYQILFYFFTWSKRHVTYVEIQDYMNTSEDLDGKLSNAASAHKCGAYSADAVVATRSLPHPVPINI